MKRHKSIQIGKEIAWNLLTVSVVLILIFPILWVFLSSVKPEREIMSTFGIPTSITLEHFRAVMQRSLFRQALANSLTVASTSALGAVSVALPAAYSLARFRYRIVSWMGMIILAGQMVPAVVILVPLVVVMRNVGLSNTLTGLTIAHLMLGLPIAVWMLRGYVEEIPFELEEAAWIDGCSRLGAIRWIVLPLVSPALVAVTTFAYILSWGEYILALALNTSTSVKTLPLALQTLFDQYSFSWGQVMAGGVYISLPIVLLFLVFRRYIVGGLTAGGVKG